MTLPQRLEQIKSELPDGVRLVVVSKFHPIEEIQNVYDLGVRDFGENIVQELLPKYEALPKDIRWHFIGGLQRNKVRQIIPFVSLIHSVDSVRLYEEIIKRAASIPRSVDILFQVHIAEETTKSGFAVAEAKETILELCSRTEDAPFRVVRGLMGMATNTEDSTLVGKEFATLNQLFETIKSSLPQPQADRFNILSMGMSQDWQIAVREGSNLVRIGSLIMGQRTPSHRN